jgi:hypothetical protein
LHLRHLAKGGHWNAPRFCLDAQLIHLAAGGDGVMIAEICFILAGFLNHSRSLNNRLSVPVIMTIYQQTDPA